MPLGQQQPEDFWRSLLRGMGGTSRLLIGSIIVLVCSFLLFWMLLLVLRAGSFVLRIWG
jgi:hypothetical protein